MSKKTFLVPLLCVAMTVCGPTPSQEPKLEQDVRREHFDRFLHDYLAVFNSGDARRLGSFFGEDTIHAPATGPELAGREAVEGYYTDFFAQLKPRIVRLGWSWTASLET